MCRPRLKAGLKISNYSEGEYCPMKKYLLLLFLIPALLMAGGPTPLPQIDTINIIDGAVTAIKTDGSLALSDLSNVATDTDLQLDNLTVTDVNGVAPLTAASQSQALVGLNTVDFAAKNITASGTITNDYGTYGTFRTGEFNIVAGGIATFATDIFPGLSEKKGVLIFTDRGVANAQGCFGLGAPTNTTCAKYYGSANTSNSKGTASSVNVYNVSANVYEIQNTTAAIVRLDCLFTGCK